MAEDRCRDCGAPVRWATTSGGYRRPFELEPSADGEYVLDYQQARVDATDQIVPGGWRAEWVSQAFRREAVLHAQHRDSCTPALPAEASTEGAA